MRKEIETRAYKTPAPASPRNHPRVHRPPRHFRANPTAEPRETRGLLIKSSALCPLASREDVPSWTKLALCRAANIFGERSTLRDAGPCFAFNVTRTRPFRVLTLQTNTSAQSILVTFFFLSPRRNTRGPRITRQLLTFSRAHFFIRFVCAPWRMRTHCTLHFDGVLLDLRMRLRSRHSLSYVASMTAASRPILLRAGSRAPNKRGPSSRLLNELGAQPGHHHE